MWRNRQVAFIDYNKTEYTDLHLARLSSKLSALGLKQESLLGLTRLSLIGSPPAFGITP